MPKLSQLTPTTQIAAEELGDPEIRREHERTALAHAVAMRVIGYRVEHRLSQTALARRRVWSGLSRILRGKQTVHECLVSAAACERQAAPVRRA